jgi:LPXTG-site transpeptidase (sortase) family protein
MATENIDQKVYKPPKPKKIQIPWGKLIGYFLIIATFAVVFIIFLPWEKFYFQKYLLRRPEINTAQITNGIKPEQKKQDIYFKIETSGVKIVVPVVEGVSEADLKKGIGHHPETPWPDKKSGNVILAGHSSDIDPNNDYGQIFRDLNKVKIGDQVLIIYPNSEYIYKVIGRYEIAPTDTTLFGQDGGPRLTFYTCSPVFTNWRRLVYVAILEQIKTQNR